MIALARIAGTRSARPVRAAARLVHRAIPSLGGALVRSAGRVAGIAVTREEIERRLASARLMFDDIDLFVAPSASIAGEFGALGVDRSRIRVSDYGFVPLHRHAKAPFDGVLRIGFVGTLAWHKGAHLLVSAAAGLPRDRYAIRIFGSPDVAPDYVATLRANASGLPIVFEAPFERSDLSDVYSSLDVLVVPSVWLENSPLVIHEAFMAGVPVVAARIGGIADLVEHDRSGLLVDPGSTHSLAAALRRLLDEPNLLASLRDGVATRPRVKTIAQDAEEWNAAYAQVLSRRSAAAVV